MKEYFRPLGLVFGADAKSLISAGQAGALGGMGHIGFTMVERMARDGAREVVSFADASAIPEIHHAVSSRPDFAGLKFDATRLMGIVNVTPDSFSDGGLFHNSSLAIAHGREMAAWGADILDVGGESTRPGSDAVTVEEEGARIMPVIEALSADHVVSVDTRKASLMSTALKAGARIINDVSALNYDKDSTAVVARSTAPVILMHAQGEPRTMQLQPKYDHVVFDVYDALAAFVARAEAAGVPRARICVDPGIGFGKTFRQNLELLNHLTIFHGLGVALLVGLSRKGFIGGLTGKSPASARVSGSIGGAVHAALSGAHILRVHDVRETQEALTVFNAALQPHSADI